MLGQIVDYLAPPSALAPLFLAALGHFRERGAAGVVCLHRSPIAARLLPRLGFLRLASDCRLMVHPGDSSAAARNLLSDPSAWFVAAGDSDADHPRAPE
jgi:hypothetical protein